MMTITPDLNLRKRLSIIMMTPALQHCKAVIRNLRFKESTVIGQWNFIEKTEGAYDFAWFDQMIADVMSVTSVFPQVRLFQAPAWVDTSLHPRGDKPHQWVPNLPVSKVPQWEAFVETICSRYHDKIKYWNLDIETNVEGLWKGNPEEYAVNVIVPAAEIIHRYGGTVVAPGTTIQKHESPAHYHNAIDHMNRILRVARKYIDIISVHSYGKSAKRVIDQTKTFRLDSDIGRNPIWVTESGFPETWEWVPEEWQDSLRQLFIAGQRRQLERFQEFVPFVESTPWLGRTDIYRGWDVKDEAERHGTNGLLNWRLNQKLAAKYLKEELMKDKVKK